MERSALDEVAACAERTLAADSARIRFTHDMDTSLSEQRPRRRGGLLRPLVRLAGAAIWKAFDHVSRRWTSLRFEGLVEPSRRRHILVSSKLWAEVYKDGQRWTGRPGQPLASLKPMPSPGILSVWFLLGGLRGLIDATAEGEDVVRGTPCRRLAARVDFSRASAATPGGLQPPTVDRFEDLLALPFTVWVDGSHVRRVRFQESVRTMRVELWDFGVSTDGLDWSRLPDWGRPDAEEGGTGNTSRVRRLLARARAMTGKR